MTNKIDVTIRFDKYESDMEKLKKIMKEMDGFEASATNKDDAFRQVKEEFRRRLIQSGLSK